VGERSFLAPRRKTIGKRQNLKKRSIVNNVASGDLGSHEHRYEFREKSLGKKGGETPSHWSPLPWQSLGRQQHMGESTSTRETAKGKKNLGKTLSMEIYFSPRKTTRRGGRFQDYLIGVICPATKNSKKKGFYRTAEEKSRGEAAYVQSEDRRKGATGKAQTRL